MRLGTHIDGSQLSALLYFKKRSNYEKCHGRVESRSVNLVNCSATWCHFINLSDTLYSCFKPFNLIYLLPLKSWRCHTEPLRQKALFFSNRKSTITISFTPVIYSFLLTNLWGLDLFLFKVEHPRPARSAGRLKKRCPWKFFCVVTIVTTNKLVLTLNFPFYVRFTLGLTNGMHCSITHTWCYLLH